MRNILFTILVLVNLIQLIVGICNSNDYCPGGWNVLRRPDGTAHTCNAMGGQKCPKPYSCVHSRCDMDFCCAHSYKIEQFKRQQEIDEDIRQAELEDEMEEL